MLVDGAASSMEPLFIANSLLRRRRFEECVKVCTEILEKNPYDQVALLHRGYTCTQALTLLFSSFVRPPLRRLQRLRGISRFELLPNRRTWMRWRWRRRELLRYFSMILPLLILHVSAYNNAIHSVCLYSIRSFLFILLFSLPLFPPLSLSPSLSPSLSLSHSLSLSLSLPLSHSLSPHLCSPSQGQVPL